MKHIKVVAAIIHFKGNILCVQRGNHKLSYISNKYEFPGGKVEQGETDEEAIIREILEELHMQISVESELITIEHEYPDFALTMKCFNCTSASDTVVLTEHINYLWLTTDKLDTLDWAAADLPAVDILGREKDGSKQ